MSELREIQLNLLEDWLKAILDAKEKNPKAIVATLMSMEAVDKSISAIKSEFMKAVGEDKIYSNNDDDVDVGFADGCNTTKKEIRQKVKEM